MRRIILPLSAALTLTGISILTARAHSGLETDQAAPGAYKAVIRIPHGKPLTSGVQEISWSGGDVTPGQKLYFKTTQTRATAGVAWDQRPAEGQDAHALDHPAPAPTILAESGGQSEHDGHGVAAVTAGDLEITSAWARAMLPGQPAGGGYLSIANKGAEADRLVGISTPAAGKAEVHEMKVVDDVMVMRPVDGGLEVPAGATVELKPGGYHLMFMQVAKPFAEGDAVKITLEFEKAGKVDVVLPVRAASGGDHSNH